MPSEIVYKPVGKIKPIYAGGTITPPKFMPSYYEWLGENGTQIIKYKSLSAAGSTIVYTVPNNQTFFLTNLALSGDCDGVGTGYVIIERDNFVELLTLRFPSAKTTGTQSLNFTIPLKFVSTDALRLIVSSNARGTSTATGFLVSNKDIPVF